jgi:hypothetical protein
MTINKHDLFLSLRRTIVPLVVGAVAASVFGPWIPSSLVAEWTTVALAAVYYTSLRLLELKVPAFGLLLGGRGTPTYTDPELEFRAFQDFIKHYNEDLDNLYDDPNY